MLISHHHLLLAFLFLLLFLLQVTNLLLSLFSFQQPTTMRTLSFFAMISVAALYTSVEARVGGGKEKVAEAAPVVAPAAPKKAAAAPAASNVKCLDNLIQGDVALAFDVVGGSAWNGPEGKLLRLCSMTIIFYFHYYHHHIMPIITSSSSVILKSCINP